MKFALTIMVLIAVAHPAHAQLGMCTNSFGGPVPCGMQSPFGTIQPVQPVQQFQIPTYAAPPAPAIQPIYQPPNHSVTCTHIGITTFCN